MRPPYTIAGLASHVAGPRSASASAPTSTGKATSTAPPRPGTGQLPRHQPRGDDQRQRSGQRRRPPAHPLRGPPVRLQAPHHQVRQDARTEPAQHPHRPAPRVVRAAGEQVRPGDRRHQRQRAGGEQRDGQVTQPVEHQRSHREQQVGQPLRADRPGRAHPRGAVEERRIPQLDQDELLQVLRKADDRLHRLEGDPVVGAPDQPRHDPDREQVEHQRVRGPDPAGAGPDEAGGRPHPQGRPEPVEVGVGDDEAAEHEEQVDAQRTRGDQRPEDVDGGSDAVEAGEVEVEQHDPRRRDDPQPGERPELSRAGSNLVARAGGTRGGWHRRRHDRRNDLRRATRDG